MRDKNKKMRKVIRKLERDVNADNLEIKKMKMEVVRESDSEDDDSDEDEYSDYGYKSNKSPVKRR